MLKIKVKCDYCGKEFEKLKREIGKTKHNYCCRKCVYKSQQKYNEIIIKDDYAEIIINSPKYGIIKTIIDIEDINKINMYNWHLQGNYINSKTSKLSIHRIIMNNPKGMIVDHINHNTLDNRKKNLRVCTSHENLFNRVMLKNNKSGYKYIHYIKSGFWSVHITINKKQLFFGSFKNIEDAITKRDKILNSIKNTDKFFRGDLCLKQY